MGKTKISKIFANAGTPVDPDAFAFITAAAITDYGQKQAINKLVNDLKANSLWNKFDCLYPMVGGDATKHSFNLKNPLRYNLTFFGGWTHSSTGALPNGTNGYADTGFNDLLTQLNSIHLSFYSRTTSAGAFTEMGVYGTGPNAGILVRNDLNGLTYLYNHNDNNTSIAVLDSKTFITNSRTASNSSKIYKNGISILNSAVVTASLKNLLFFVGALNINGAASQFTNRECALASIGKGLSDAEATAYNTIVTAFQTSLNRQNP